MFLGHIKNMQHFIRKYKTATMLNILLLFSGDFNFWSNFQKLQKLARWLQKCE